MRPNQVPLTNTNPGASAATSDVQRAWATWSAQQDFRTEDMVNMAQENRDIFYAGNGFTKPYPGDSRVLYPNQVPGAGSAPAGDPADQPAAAPGSTAKGATAAPAAGGDG